MSNKMTDSLKLAATEWVAQRIKNISKELTFEESFKAGFLTAITRILLDLDQMLVDVNEAEKSEGNLNN
jgi:hypothetical protein